MYLKWTRGVIGGTGMVIGGTGMVIRGTRGVIGEIITRRESEEGDTIRKVFQVLPQLVSCL